MSGSNEILMLGGGNPGHIPEVQKIFQRRLLDIANSKTEFTRIIGNYDQPQGEGKFIEALASLLRKQFGWDISPENIALTAGSQSGFFFLFNMFGGDYADGSQRRIMLPMVPEYIGYSDVGLSDDLFIANKPEIEILGNHVFKYHVDFSHLQLPADTGALCVSRPTNPTGNVLSDAEIQHLLDICQKRDIPLIIDNAYGMPFPNIIFTDVNLFWSSHTILCMSLSKLGLPGARIGIILAQPDVIRAITNMNAVLNLALGSFGPALTLEMIGNGEIINISRELIRPYYETKARAAIALLEQELNGVDFYIHKPEGAIFLWLWIPELPISSEELYQRLKQKGVLVISGHHFFPGLKEDWPHQHECLRITYSMQTAVVEQGLKIIAAEIIDCLQTS